MTTLGDYINDLVREEGLKEAIRYADDTEQEYEKELEVLKAEIEGFTEQIEVLAATT